MGGSVTLRKQVNVLDYFALVVGTVIGSGIFISPKGVLQNTGTIGWALIVLVVCGVFSTLGALCYAELGTSIRKSGGDYTYIKDSAGPVFAFLRLWSSILGSRTGSDAVLSITAATYLTSPIFTDCENGVPFAITRMLACTILLFTSFCNSVSVPLTRKVQIIFTVAKVLGLAVIIVSGIVLLIQGKQAQEAILNLCESFLGLFFQYFLIFRFNLFTGNTSNFQNAFNVKEVEWQQFPLAFYSGLFAYTGWQNTVNITEEMINPARIIPKTIIAAIAFVTLVYVTTNVAYFVALSPEEVLRSDAVAVSYGLRVLGNWWLLMPLALALSIIGSMNGSLFTASRQFHVAGRDGQFPEVFSMVHIDRKTPLPAATLIVCISFVSVWNNEGGLPIATLMLVSDSVYSLINFLSFSRWTFVAMTTASLPYFRWKYPDAKRPFKVPLAIPFIFILMSVFMVAGSIYSAPRHALIGIVMTLSGVPVWFICVWWKNKPRRLIKVFDNITIFLQRTLYVVPPDDVISKIFDVTEDKISSEVE
ncbi:Cystine/glutamate transporter [Holothuria leucospilota]|uniref:Cystine/glutamate transporter n=1 Tax=Holothuria leucospilota TaxID=206669 RepID=A0A9Q1H9V8_HOLLE|nr:Cystine/glutamate transporter [Holothuria leucospilota]